MVLLFHILLLLSSCVETAEPPVREGGVAHIGDTAFIPGSPDESSPQEFSWSNVDAKEVGQTIDTNPRVQDENNDRTKSVPKPEPSLSTEMVEQVPTEMVQKREGRHELWDQLLSKYVSATGKVNYPGLKKESGVLEKYLQNLQATNLSTLSRDERLAFWINVYNAFTVKKILDHYPVNSIQDIDGGKPWDDPFINIDGRQLSLDDVENQIIRPEFEEPRIHFAVNCAAVSCPPLLNRAYTAEKLESQLDRQTRSFINNPAYNSISAEHLSLSRIFEWYETDFGEVRKFVNSYTDIDISPEATVSYMTYNWELNN